MLRIGLFLATNFAIMLLISIIFQLFGLEGILAENGVDLNLTALLVMSGVIGFGGSIISLLMSKWLAKRSMGVHIIETPANPTIVLTDIAAIVEIAHEHGALVLVDNTFASPILQRPLELGADIVMHSMTKFINGHTDVVAGMIVPKTEALFKKIRPVHFYVGACMDPHQAWLALRGFKTLSLRVLAAQEGAQKLAQWLEYHEKVEWVRYPGLASHPQHELSQRQMDGPGSLISFEVKGGLEAGAKLLDSVELMTLAVSLGGVESLIQHPSSMTHAAMRPKDRIEAGISDGLVRLSVGCEDVEDLIADLQQAFDQV